MLLYGNKVKATLKLANQTTGAATAQFIVVGKREKFPVELVRQEGDWLVVECSAISNDLRSPLAQRRERVDRHIRTGADGNTAGASKGGQMTTAVLFHRH